MDRRKIDVGLATFLIAISIVILASDGLVEGGAASDLGSMFLPRVVAVLMILFSTTLAFQALRQLAASRTPQGDALISTQGFSGILIYLGIFVAYWLSVPLVGFLVATPITMLAVAWLLNGRRWLLMIATSVLVPAVIFYGSREFLRVYLPTWSL